MKFMLYQQGGSFNHGCEALATTISQQIKSRLKDSHITLCSHHSDQDQLYKIPNIDDYIQDPRWLTRWSLPWLIHQINSRTLNSRLLQNSFLINKVCVNAAKHMDVCVAIGGDNYCYDKGKFYWATDRMVKQSCSKNFLWGCSVEPKDVPGELADHLDIFDGITARDPLTYNALKEAGLGNKVTKVADPAFLLEPQEVAFPKNWKKGKMVGINLSPMALDFTEHKKEVVDSIYALIDHVLKDTDMNIVLIPHVRISYTDDIDVLKPIFKNFESTNRVLLIDDLLLNCRQLKYLISNCRFFVGARTHAIVAAYSTGVPALALGYSIKAKGIAQDIFGFYDNLVLPVQTLSDKLSTIKGVDYLFDNEEKLKSLLDNTMPSYKEKALLSMDKLLEIIQK